MNKKIIIFGMSLLLVGGGIIAYPTVDEYIIAKYNIPVNVQMFGYNVGKEYKKDYNLIKQIESGRSVFYEFTDAKNKNITNYIQMLNEENKYEISKGNRLIKFEKREEIIYYLEDLGLI